MDSGINEVVFNCESFRLYKGGRVERFAGTQATVPAGFDADTGVTSKDVVIDAATGVAARLYLPTIQTAPPSSESDDSGSRGAATKLPIFVYFHGGYFVVGSPAHPFSHHFVSLLAARARVLVVSVRYRLAPEHMLPTAYDDAWAALNWAASGLDPWLSDHGDRGRVFVAGSSAGANIAHNMAIAAGVRGLQSTTPAAPARIEGVILFHPSFASEQKMEAESEEFCRANKIRWAAIFPDSKYGLDDPRINPMAVGAPSLARLAGERLLVCTASEDPRALRGRAYYDAVRTSCWHGEADWFESNGEGHCFFALNPVCLEAVKLMERVVDFVAGH